MVYLAGKIDHKLETTDMVEHIVGLVEARAAVIDAEMAAKELVTEAAE
jgi:(E)-4-hydroxy-3-methylbut-2-enyl-diphosphate synthase